MTFKPMLAGKAPDDLSTLTYPLIASPKLDGIRCIIKDGVAVSRTMKLIPNLHIQKCLKGLPDGLDGELICGAPVGLDVMNRTSTGVMREENEPEFTFWVFDKHDIPAGYKERLWRIPESISGHNFVNIVSYTEIRNVEELMDYESRCVAEGYEGVMTRSIDSPYKQGRSTTKEQYLLKVKRFNDAEAVVVGYTEKMHNANEATKDAFGRTKRSSHKANKIPTGMLGALECVYQGVRFDIGTGYDDALRKELWADKDSLVGRLAKFKYQDLTPDGVPRFPVFLGWRDERDT